MGKDNLKRHSEFKKCHYHKEFSEGSHTFTVAGSKFDIGEFHHVLLGCGAVPLDVLESLVQQYINTGSKQ